MSAAKKDRDTAAGKRPQRTCVVVLGMHRSGTSALTRVISLLGAALPGNLMPAITEVNSAGFWESLDVVSINNDIFESMNSRWDDVTALHAESLSASTLAAHQVRIAEFLEREFHNNELFVIKDPRLSRLLRLWLPVLNLHKVDTKVILAVRHPLEVAASLVVRDKFSLDKALYLWLTYTIDSILHSNSLDCGIVIHSELMADWRSSIEQAQDEADITWSIDIEDAAREIESFIDRRLVHHIHTAQKKPEACNSELLQMANKLYLALILREPKLYSVAKQMQATLGEKESWFAPLLFDQRKQFYLEIANRNIVEKNLFALRNEFDEKCRHVVDLDRLLTNERHLALDLRQEFSDKCKHVELLLEENADLLAQIRSLTSNTQNDEWIKNQSLKSDFETQPMQFRTEMKRAEAQLQLLKSLLLNE